MSLDQELPSFYPGGITTSETLSDLISEYLGIDVMSSGVVAVDEALMMDAEGDLAMNQKRRYETF